MVNIYLLPADEGEFIWVRYGENMNYANFVVIFAKNGVGKTSFFDGVEFALKGEVGRIIDLALKDKNVKYRDAIYHNRDNADKDAFILMKLDDGRIIERRVSDISE